MSRSFNTAGPCQEDVHYTLSPTLRLPSLERLIAQRNYFVIHAPRQVGKTTAMLALAKQLTDSGKYTAVMVSAEVGAPFSQDISGAEDAILGAWRDNISFRLPPEMQPPDWTTMPSGQKIRSALQIWAQASPLPLVIFIDEIDALQDLALISILRQLRDGYPNRPKAFPQSVGLIGLRDVRDYKVASGGSDRLNTSSPFNIKVRSLTIRNFNAEEVAELYAQHTQDTGQIFTPSASALAFELTQGQPWLVNALAKEIVEELVTDESIAITPEHILTAKEIIIQRQDTHLDSLAERLRENRVKAIIEPILAGLELGNVPNDDIQFLIDLGLCKMDTQGGLAIANPIYREVLPRVLTLTPMASLPQIAPSWLTAEGKLDTQALLKAFLEFWLQHGEPLLKSASYPEIAPHLVLMAFLHRVINGGGTLEREYAIGRDRMDLCLRYGEVILGIELKVWRNRKVDPISKGLEQLDGYLAGLGQDEGWLVIFDRRDNVAELAERLKTEIHTTPMGRRITVIRA
ncbi:MAG TPA: polyketide biosynthesis operon protein CyrO [Cyanobacteria bacterium UBA11149]|nr:polyketide biosynthesis operon protein CyrO [Cyanobacteria bacterium UBA11367]HBE59974.1 polyketide biosynthesis operon protein CyrO [Cyanobacteria bacterium UBA11366]HBK62724.1 polyketide biosynthesis operon protein CyrO [Cyanobacteria bacterium UBA11166]HBR72511.1 polyketide biosynthesis operon protein CyrO [Cyanobacteria bacterium UBA11159]HBS70962.1 polyketide biosynthesis operon protein CyrO [Cyanobacteria bacterium UBA11153]HBW88636.1 polyketide biosynthesis operon protein CyrO [Cyano